MTEIDHEFTSEIACPHCGYGSEWDPCNSEVFDEEYPSCDKEYRAVVRRSVDF